MLKIRIKKAPKIKKGSTVICIKREDFLKSEIYMKADNINIGDLLVIENIVDFKDGDLGYAFKNKTYRYPTTSFKLYNSKEYAKIKNK